MVPRCQKTLIVLVLLFIPGAGRSQELPAGLEFVPGPINGAVVRRDSRRILVYGHPDAGQASELAAGLDALLLTHHRRDVVWPALPFLESGVDVWAPDDERGLIAAPEEFWSAFTQVRFNDSVQQSTKIIDRGLTISRWVTGGETIDWNGHSIQVIATPGFTRGAVTYVMDLEGKRVAFTGDLIYGDGQILDLYSFQEAIRDARVGGYHGYGGRLGELVASLRAVKAADPDLIVPARGALIDNPAEAIDKLISRVQALYRNYLSTNALHWYFKEDRMRICGERVLGAGAEIQLMPYAEHVDAPEWVWERGTSRMIVSESGAGFLLDCWHQNVIDGVAELMQQQTIDRVEGIFVTHYHDDHTARVQDAAELYECPVYATHEYADILENPFAYHMPAQLKNAVKKVTRMANGQSMNWHEFKLTFYYFPGQAIYHGALMVQKEGEVPIFFIGDSFAPSGMDDYCVQNRNLVHPDTGYLLCLSKLREIEGDYWLINQHIPYVFRFSDDEMDYLETRYRERIAILRELFPWDDPNYGIDEQWAVFYPYGLEAEAGAEARFEVRLTNHSPTRRKFTVTPRLGIGMQLLDCQRTIELESRQSGSVSINVKLPAETGEHLLRADVHSDGMQFNDWIEALISIQ